MRIVSRLWYRKIVPPPPVKSRFALAKRIALRLRLGMTGRLVSRLLCGAALLGCLGQISSSHRLSFAERLNAEFASRQARFQQSGPPAVRAAGMYR